MFFYHNITKAFYQFFSSRLFKYKLLLELWFLLRRYLSNIFIMLIEKLCQAFFLSFYMSERQANSLVDTFFDLLTLFNSKNSSEFFAGLLLKRKKGSLRRSKRLNFRKTNYIVKVFLSRLRAP